MGKRSYSSTYSKIPTAYPSLSSMTKSTAYKTLNLAPSSGMVVYEVKNTSDVRKNECDVGAAPTNLSKENTSKHSHQEHRERIYTTDSCKDNNEENEYNVKDDVTSFTVATVLENQESQSFSPHEKFLSVSKMQQSSHSNQHCFTQQNKLPQSTKHFVHHQLRSSNSMPVQATHHHFQNDYERAMLRAGSYSLMDYSIDSDVDEYASDAGVNGTSDSIENSSNPVGSQKFTSSSCNSAVDIAHTTSNMTTVSTRYTPSLVNFHQGSSKRIPSKISLSRRNDPSSIFRIPSRNGIGNDDLKKDAITSSKQINLLDVELDDQDEDGEVASVDKRDDNNVLCRGKDQQHAARIPLSLRRSADTKNRAASKMLTTATTQDSNRYSTLRSEESKTISSNPMQQNDDLARQYQKRKRVKSIVSNALRAVADGFVTQAMANSCDGLGRSTRNFDDVEENDSKKEEVADYNRLSGNKRGVIDIGDDDDDNNNLGGPRGERTEGWKLSIATQKYVEGMTDEFVNLNRQLRESESQIQLLLKEKINSYDTITNLQKEIESVQTTLQEVRNNSANAHADAVSANDKSRILSTKIHDLESIAKEANIALESARKERDEISCAARSLEKRLSQVELDLKTVRKAKEEAEHQRNSLQSQLKQYENSARSLRANISSCQNEIKALEGELKQLKDLQKCQADKAHHAQSELRIAQLKLSEATTAASTAESNIKSLLKTIDTLRKDNESLSEKIRENEMFHSKDRSKQYEALSSALKEIKSWENKCKKQSEEIQKLTDEKFSLQRDVNNLKNHFFREESRPTATPMATNLHLINAYGAGDKHNEQGHHHDSDDLEGALESPSRQLTFSADKENNQCSKSQKGKSFKGGNHKLPSSNKCCLCFKCAYGTMKYCQCGKRTCKKQAHATCVNIKLAKTVSNCVSHPGTPAPPLPTILCSGIWEK